MSIRLARSLCLSLFLCPLFGCVDPPESSEPVGKLSAALQFPLTQHDVISVRFDVVAAGGGCDDAALATRTIPLESEPLPASVAGPWRSAWKTPSSSRAVCSARERLRPTQ